MNDLHFNFMTSTSTERSPPHWTIFTSNEWAPPQLRYLHLYWMAYPNWATPTSILRPTPPYYDLSLDIMTSDWTVRHPPQPCDLHLTPTTFTSILGPPPVIPWHHQVLPRQLSWSETFRDNNEDSCHLTFPRPAVMFTQKLSEKVWQHIKR